MNTEKKQRKTHATGLPWKQGDHICYKCADVFNSKTLLLKHIASVNGEEPCQKFKANKCTIGNKCFFKHVETNVQLHHQIQHLHQLSHSSFFLPPHHMSRHIIVGGTEDVQMMCQMIDFMMKQMNLSKQ